MNTRPKIKICGVTRVQDVLSASIAEVDAIGVNFARESPRFIGGIWRAGEVKSAGLRAIADCGSITHHLRWAGVFVNPLLDDVLKIAETLKLDVIQLHGEETPDFVAELKRRAASGVAIWKALRVSSKADLAA